jgi:hypothetical protein
LVLVLHPSICLEYFEDTSKWDQSIAAHAHMLLEHLCEVYSAEGSPEKAAAAAADVPSVMTSIFLDAICNMNPAQKRTAISELEAFFSGTYPCADGNILRWWKVNVHLFDSCDYYLSRYGRHMHLTSRC